MTSTPLLPDLTAQAIAAAHSRTSACPCGATVTLAERPDATVVRHADTVAKAHASDIDVTDLTSRMAAATRLPEILLPPLTPIPVDLHDRPVSFWPYGTPVDPEDPDAAPWEAAATLLARLHRTPAPVPLPPMRGPAKAALALSRLRATTDGTLATPVLRAWDTLPAWARDEAPSPTPPPSATATSTSASSSGIRPRTAPGGS